MRMQLAAVPALLMLFRTFRLMNVLHRGRVRPTNIDHVVEMIQDFRVSHDAGLPVFVNGAPEGGMCLLKLNGMWCAGRIVRGLIERPHVLRKLLLPMLTKPVEGLEDVVLCTFGHPVSAAVLVKVRSAGVMSKSGL